MKRAFCLLSLLFCLAADDAPPPQPKSPAAQTVVAKYQSTVRKADEVYKAALVAAAKQEALDADAALRNAMANGDIDGASELNAIKKAAIAATSSPAGVDASGKALIGRWKIATTFGPLNWTIQADRVTHNKASAWVTPTWKGNIAYLRWPDGRIERLTPVNGRILFESWAPGTYPSGITDRYGIGDREAG